MSNDAVVPGTDVEVAADVSRDFDLERISRLNEAAPVLYSSIRGDDFESKLRVIDALTNAERFDEHLNEVIMWKDVVVRPQSAVNEETGELQTFPSITLIAEDGTAYTAGSVGVYSAVETFLGILGHPSTWPSAVPVKLVQENTRSKRRVFTLRRAAVPPKK